MYQGVIVPLVTPLDMGGVVSEADVANLISSVRDEVTALMPALSSGEGWSLSPRQWSDMVALTVRYASGLPVIAGVQLPDTAGALLRLQAARELGAAAVAVTTPFGAHVRQGDILTHYQALADTGMPVFVYNETALSGNQTKLDTLLQISQMPGIIGIKESSGNPRFTRELAQAVTRIPVFEGRENLLYQTTGVAGCVAALANLEPALCARVLAEPTQQRQHEIDMACERYGVLREDWYYWIKRELVTRGIITTAHTVAGTARFHRPQTVTPT